MRITAILAAARSVPGRQWAGKTRKIWKYSATRKANTQKQFARVAQNVVLLESPAITYEQDFSHKKNMS
eukprot:m.358687 g.358687  ORF g.358687 m.358687 type:complete len:69 (-) comp18230_c0_seq1:203-409(-)